MKLKLILAVLLFALLLPYAGVQAQPNSPLDTLVYICVEEQTPGTNDEQSASPPALIGFGQSDMLGFIMSRQSLITVYSPQNVAAAIGIYNLAPDAISGAYRRDSKLGILRTDAVAPANRACSEAYPELITEDHWMSLPFPVSAEQGFFIQIGDDSYLDEGQILGAAGFHASSQTGVRDFQIVQLSAQPAVVYLPYIDVQERFMVVANKDVTIRRSYPQNLSAWSAPMVPDERSILLPMLANEQPAINLPVTMREAHFRIYPARGMVIDYPSGGMFQIGMSATPAARDITEAGQRVRAIEGGFYANFYTEFPRLSIEAFGRLEGSSTASVVRVDDRGQLIVRNGDEDVTIEAWFVDIVGSSQPNQ